MISKVGQVAEPWVTPHNRLAGIVKATRQKASRGDTAIYDRAIFLSLILRISLRIWVDVVQIHKLYPDAPVRFHWTQENYGAHLFPTLTDSFPISLKDIQVFGDLHFREVSAFKSGETSVVEFFGDGSNPLNESHRRAKTPALLEADPSDFVILVNTRKNGRQIAIADGNHRFAIASMASLETIQVKFVPKEPNYIRGIWRENLWRWFFFPFE